LNLTPPKDAGYTKKALFECWLAYYNSHAAYRNTCFQQSVHGRPTLKDDECEWTYIGGNKILKGKQIKATKGTVIRRDTTFWDEKNNVACGNVFNFTHMDAKKYLHGTVERPDGTEFKVKCTAGHCYAIGFTTQWRKLNPGRSTRNKKSKQSDQQRTVKSYRLVGPLNNVRWLTEPNPKRMRSIASRRLEATKKVIHLILYT